jgi:hypothetical protein
MRLLASLYCNEPDGIRIGITKIDSNYSCLFPQKELACVCHPDLVSAGRGERRRRNNFACLIFVLGSNTNYSNYRDLKLIVLHGRPRGSIQTDAR